MNIEKKEFEKYISKLFNGVEKPLYGTIEITNYCPYNCVHCFETDDRAKSYWRKEKIIKLIDDIVKEEGLAIVLSGGEPLLHPDFKEIYIHAKQKGLVVTVYSNLYYISDEIIELFKEYPVSSVSTSCYGFSKETYEMVTHKKGSYQAFFQNIKRLQENNIPIDVKYMVIQENYKELMAAKAFFKGKGIPFIYSYSLRAMDSGNTNNLIHQLTPDQVVKLELKDEMRTQYWKNRYYSIDKDDERYIKWKNRCKYLCPIGVKGYYISANGMFYLCSSERKYGYDLNTGTFREAWNNFRKKVINEKPEKELRCWNCDLFMLCNPCVGDNYLVNRDEYEPDKYSCQVAALRKKFIIDKSTFPADKSRD